MTDKNNNQQRDFAEEIAKKLDSGEITEVMTVDGTYTNSEDFLEAQKEK